MSGDIHIYPSGTKPKDPEDQRDSQSVRREKLRKTCGFIFAGLTEEEIEDRLAFYSLPRTSDPTKGLDKILSDDSLPLPPEERVFRLVVPMLQGMLRAECARPGDGKGNREAIADLADFIIDKLLDAASGCTTRGEQHARVLHRHPFALSDAYALSNDSPLTVIQAKNRIHPLREFEAVREIEDLKLELKAFLPTKRVRKRKPDELCTKVKERFPELESLLTYPGNIIELPRERAARFIWGRRQEPPITEKQVSSVLAGLRKRIRARTSTTTRCEKTQEAKPTPPEREHS